VTPRLTIKSHATENPDGTLTRYGMERVHLYAVKWVEHAVRDLTLEREFPELTGSFYDVRASPSYAREQAIPFDDIEPVFAIPFVGGE
jgi:hypothetical protein